MINKAILLTRLTADPELTHTQSGLAVTKLRTVTNKKTKDGERATFHTIKCFGKTAENCSKYLSKGRMVYIEGEINNDSYEKDGVKKFFSEIVAHDVKFIGGDSKEVPVKTSQQVVADYSADEIPF